MIKQRSVESHYFHIREGKREYFKKIVINGAKCFAKLEHHEDWRGERSFWWKSSHLLLKAKWFMDSPIELYTTNWRSTKDSSAVLLEELKTWIVKTFLQDWCFAEGAFEKTKRREQRRYGEWYLLDSQREGQESSGGNSIQGGQESLEEFYIMGLERVRQLHDILKENETRALIRSCIMRQWHLLYESWILHSSIRQTIYYFYLRKIYRKNC